MEPLNPCVTPDTPLRGTTSNLAAAVGTAVAGALLIGLPSAAVMSCVAENPSLPAGIQLRVNLDSITFISNDPLESVIARTTAMPEQKEAVGVSTEARLRAPRIGLLIMAGLALVTILPASRGPG